MCSRMSTTLLPMAVSDVQSIIDVIRCIYSYYIVYWNIFSEWTFPILLLQGMFFDILFQFCYLLALFKSNPIHFPIISPDFNLFLFHYVFRIFPDSPKLKPRNNGCAKRKYVSPTYWLNSFSPTVIRANNGYWSNGLPISRQHFPTHEKDVQSDGDSWNCFSSRFNFSRMHSLLFFLIYESESRKSFSRRPPVPAGYMSTHMFPGAIRFLYELRGDQPLSDEAFQCFQITFRNSKCSVSESCINKLSYYRKDTYFCSFCKMNHKMEIARQPSRLSFRRRLPRYGRSCCSFGGP